MYDVFENPFQLMNLVSLRDDRLILSFKTYELKQDSICGDIEVTYLCGGMDCQFLSDLSVSDLYLFDYQLDSAYDGLSGTEPKVTLESTDSAVLNRSRLTFRFDKKGNCIISGCLMNRDHYCHSGIILDDFEIDGAVIPEILSSMKRFFDTLSEFDKEKKFLQ